MLQVKSPMRFVSLLFRVTAGLSLFVCAPARAAEPSTTECLAASDASLKAGNEHKLRAERQQLLICASSSCPGEIRKECARRVEEVNSSIPTLVFQAKDPTGADLSDVKVTMDGDVLADHLDGSALVVDPGQHTFTFQTPGQPTVEKQLVVREGEKERSEAIQFGTPTGDDVNHPTETAGSGGKKTQKIIAVVVAGVGVAGLGVGGAFGIMAISKKNHAQDLCSTPQCNDAAGSQAWSDAKKVGNISTVGFIAGGVLLATGAVLWFTAGPSHTQVGIGPGNVRLSGTF
jgi:hypothetical protein